MANKRSYGKSRLLKELAWKVGVKQALSRKILDALAEIIYREAPLGGFVLPGVCKFDVVEKKERRIRNPRTGEALVIPPHKALRATLSNAARNAIAPKPKAVPLALYVPPAAGPEKVEVPVPDPAPAPAVEPPKAGEPVPAAPAPAAEPPKAGEPAGEGGPVSFRCPGCGQEIEAPAEAIGCEAECPMCGRILVVPKASEPDTMYGPSTGADRPKAEEPVVTAKEAEDMDPQQLKNRTIRIDTTLFGLDDDDDDDDSPRRPETPPPGEEKMISFFCRNCHQEIEATADMAGSQCACPNCGNSFEVPYFSDSGSIHDDSAARRDEQRRIEAQKHSTMRINLDDF